MFGETELEACQRLRILEVNEPEKSEGRGNDFQDAMDDVEKGLDIQAAQGSSKGNLILRQVILLHLFIKFIFSKKAAKIDKIFTLDLTLT